MRTGPCPDQFPKWFTAHRFTSSRNQGIVHKLNLAPSRFVPWLPSSFVATHFFTDPTGHHLLLSCHFLGIYFTMATLPCLHHPQKHHPYPLFLQAQHLRVTLPPPVSRAHHALRSSLMDYPQDFEPHHSNKTSRPPPPCCIHCTTQYSAPSPQEHAPTPCDISYPIGTRSRNNTLTLRLRPETYAAHDFCCSLPLPEAEDVFLSQDPSHRPFTYPNHSICYLHVPSQF